MIRKGELPKFCRDQGFIGGCTYWSPVPGHGAGGSITFDPAQFDRVGQIIGVIMNSVAAISHELGHAVSCDVSELCARASENRARQDAGLPRRP